MTGPSVTSSMTGPKSPPPGTAPAAHAAIELRRLSKVFAGAKGERVTALAPVDLRIDDGEFVTVVGPSGCGKTTLLRIIAGLMPASSGTAMMNGTPIRGPRADIGIVFQAPQLLPWRTAFKNVLLPAELLGLPMEQSRKRAKELLEMVGLAGFEQHLPSQLSGGMQQRTSIARAFLSSPDLLMMDEPFGALDALTREQLTIELQRIWGQNTAKRRTVFFITHSIPEAVFLGDRVIVMAARPGRIVEDIRVDFERPRPIGLMNSGGRFGELVAHIRDLLNVRQP